MVDIVDMLRERDDAELNLTAKYIEHLRGEIERLQGIIKDDRLEGAADEIERLREDLDLIKQIGRIEIDAKLRYAWALSEIVKLKPDDEFGAVPVETAQRIASEALKWKE